MHTAITLGYNLSTTAQGTVSVPKATPLSTGNFAAWITTAHRSDPLQSVKPDDAHSFNAEPQPVHDPHKRPSP